ncbi:hypothetical protein EN802_14075 [bacterium M00.F.Ca.ET.159.01.1.1]|nr:hypothetical protein EN802_14075 [bacterium M00.F.Ca.ET.159.01.1.1]
MRRETAELILSGSNLNYHTWLDQEVGHLALKISNLDEFSSIAMLPLAQLAAYGEANTSQLAAACDMELADLQAHLGSLCAFGFTKETADGFDVTALGEKTFIAIGKSMIIRERYELKRRLETISILFEKIDDLVEL